MKFLLPLLFLTSTLLAQTDGPAQLPIAIPSTTMTSPNTPKTVGPTDNLQVALNAAVPGDTFVVDSANVYTGSVHLPTFATCDTAHAVTIVGAAFTSGPVFRVHPGMPLPKIVLPAGASVYGGTCVQLIGFEVTIVPGSGIHYGLVVPGPSAHDLIFDRVYCHADPQDDTARCFNTSNVRNMVVENYWISDIHCMSVVGTCQDSQAIAGGLSLYADEGPILIQNGYLEAAGENILFGGGSANVVPHDVIIRGNEVAKPDSWNPGDLLNYVAVDGKDGLPHPYIVKNDIELKNCNRCLIENNYIHGSWGGFSQLGWAFLLTPKNQAGANGTNLCPICATTNITIRNNRIQKTGGALVMGFGPSDNGGWPAGSNHWSIHDNQFEHMQYKSCYQCSHYLIQISSGSTSGLVMHDISIDNNTFFVDGWLPPKPSDGKNNGFLLLTAPVAPNPAPYNISFTNNVVYSGNTPLGSTGGGTANCANSYIYNNYAGFFTNCWQNSSFTGNVILTNGYNGNPNWPVGNYELPAGANINSVPQ